MLLCIVYTVKKRFSLVMTKNDNENNFIFLFFIMKWIRKVEPSLTKPVILFD